MSAIETPQLVVQFGGWFQCRLPTDPDPTWEARGVSGYTRAIRLVLDVFHIATNVEVELPVVVVVAPDHTGPKARAVFEVRVDGELS